MLKQLVKRVPNKWLAAVYDLVGSELVDRQQVTWENEFSPVKTNYLEFTIQVTAEPDCTYTCTWAVYRNQELLHDGGDDYHATVGEAESTAIKWIKSQQLQSAAI